MSEKPKGSFKSFDELPEDLIKSIDNFEADVEKEVPETISNEAVEKWERPEVGQEEEVEKRAGGVATRKKSAELLKVAEKKDRDEPILKKSKNNLKNKKQTSPAKIKARKFQRDVQRNSLSVQEVDFEDEIKSRLPNPEDIEGTIIKRKYPKPSVTELPDAEKIEGQEFDLYENTYDPNGSIDSELPDASSIEGSEIPAEKGKSLKSAVEIAMKRTDAEAREYNSRKLKKEDIESANSIGELLQMIDKSEGIQGSKEYFDKEKLKMIIEMYVDNDEQLKDENGDLRFEYLTRSGGLRQKVFDLLQQKEEPEKIEEESVVELTPVKIKERKREASKPEIKAIRKGGVDFPEEEKKSVYSPEQFAKDEKDEKYGYLSEEEFLKPSDIEEKPPVDEVFRIPKLNLDANPKEDLPEAPLPPLKEGKIIVDEEMEDEIEASILEKKLQEKENVLREVEDMIETIKAENSSKRPFKKFLLNIGMGRAAKNLNKAEKITNRVIAEKKEIFDNLLSIKTRQEFNRIMSLDPRSKERREFEKFKFTELPDKVVYGNPGIIESYKLNDQNDEGLHLSKILSSKNIRGDVADELNLLVRKKIERKVRESLS